jgi:hypothetical protein
VNEHCGEPAENGICTRDRGHFGRHLAVLRQGSADPDQAPTDPGLMAQALIDHAERIRDVRARSTLLAASRMVDALYLRTLRAEAERDALREQVRPVLDAWRNPGSHPAHHRQVRDNVRTLWPTLTNAIANLSLRWKDPA